jgi:hypothetical protein
VVAHAAEARVAAKSQASRLLSNRNINVRLLDKRIAVSHGLATVSATKN